MQDDGILYRGRGVLACCSEVLELTWFLECPPIALRAVSTEAIGDDRSYKQKW